MGVSGDNGISVSECNIRYRDINIVSFYAGDRSHVVINLGDSKRVSIGVSDCVY